MVSSARPDPYVHEAGVSINPEFNLSLPCVCTRATPAFVPVFLVSGVRGFRTSLVSYVHVH